MLEHLDPGDVARDLPEIHALNQGAVPDVGEATEEQLSDLIGMSLETLVARVDGEVVGFAIILGPGCDYASPNYAFFRDRHPDFAYVDRIAISPKAQGLGLGRQIYETVVEALDAPVLCAEVNVRPRNDASLAFHDRLGFVEVGEQETYGGKARVRLLERLI